MLERSLIGLRALVGRSISAVRLSQGIQHRERFPVSEFIAEVASAAGMEAQARNVTLTVLPVDAAVSIEGDRQILAAVVTNLLQNAFKFTRPRSTVTLRVCAGAERVLIEVLDECTGSPARRSAISFARSNSAALIERALASASHSAGGAQTRTTAASTRATCRNGAASLRSISRELRRHPSY